MIRCRLCGELVGRPCIVEPPVELVDYTASMSSVAFADDIVERPRTGRLPMPPAAGFSRRSSLD